ncbi:tripartite motif-containing protein 45-like [Lytechinus variegatus]|uniref:tripartite motif-containing protein 45-like n=1 Tax=Lytechinus variegatus TaxID=7654 RepID=UPI001BB1ACC6|nr:tripartite motif-containing protein 45-like [Lytechinus variegatus]
MALPKQIGDVISEELECSICLDRLRSPRMLTCLHSFCEHCLKEYADQHLDAGSLHCPTCRERTVIPNDGITGLKPDFRANKLLEALNKGGKDSAAAEKQNRCSVCKSSKPRLFCEDCDLNMCQECAEFHPNIPTCRHHHVVPLTELSRGIAVPAGTRDVTVIRKCSRHDERLKFYCKTCKKCICADCTVLDHSKVDGHECVYLRDIIPEYRRDIADLVTKVNVKGKDVDSFFVKIGGVKQELDQKSREIDQAIEDEVAKIKAFLLKQSKTYVNQNRCLIDDIVQKNRSTKKDVEDVSRELHQVSSSKDDFEVAEKHHGLVQSVRRLTGVESDAFTLDSIKMNFEKLRLNCAQLSCSHHPSLNLVKQDRIFKQQNVPHAKSYLTVGKVQNGSLSVICAAQDGRVFCHEVPKMSRVDPTAGRHVRRHARQIFFSGNNRLRYSAKNPSCPYGILPNGRICSVIGNELWKGASSLLLQQIEEYRKPKADICQESCLTVNMNGYIYIVSEGLDYLLEIAPDNTVLTSQPIFGSIVPLAITTRNTSPCETFLIACKPSSVYLIDSEHNRCIFSDRGVVWESAALACGQEGRIFLLSSQESKISLRILDKEGNLQETIFRNRESKDPPKLPQTNTAVRRTLMSAHGQASMLSGRRIRRSTVLGSPYSPNPQHETATTFTSNSGFGSTSQSSQSTHQRTRLSITVASNGDMCVVLGENELMLITLEESDIFKD